MSPPVFSFGKNWRRFLGSIDEDRISEAQKSLTAMLGFSNLRGKTFLDAGSGSGLFSLAAMRLGADRVRSFDLDPLSVACTRELKNRYFSQAGKWIIEEGSVLNIPYLQSLGSWDLVYSWGVLHHTGKMWTALENIIPLVSDSGLLYIALYNDQGWISRYWTSVKIRYNRHPGWRALIIAGHAPYLIGLRFLARLLKGSLTLERGMSLWWDMLDWLGGYPFETAKPKAVAALYEQAGFQLFKQKTVGNRHGCNEYVFRKTRTAA
jgi:SAM-dependent methyltransferase